MLYFDRIDVSEGNDVNKTSASKVCDICRYWYFLNYSFKFQPNMCNRCHDLLMISMNLSDIAILNIIKNLSYIKMGKEILTFEDIEIEKNKFCRNKTPIF